MMSSRRSITSSVIGELDLADGHLEQLAVTFDHVRSVFSLDKP